MNHLRKGFTLVELLVVMAIILILVAIALPAANQARQKAKNTQVMAGIHEIQTALESYAVDHGGFYPGAHWEQDSGGNYYVGPGILGGIPSFDPTGEPYKDFYVPKIDEPGDPAGMYSRDPYYDDGTPNVYAVDELVVNGYVTDYPANPFVKATSELKAQMSNLFWFNPLLDESAGNTIPVPGNEASLDWNRYTQMTDGESMRSQYRDFGAGHFSYIPLGPSNTSGFDHVSLWAGSPTGYTDFDRSEYYRKCRGYILIGWGADRLEPEQAKGISMKYWNADQGGFDFDRNLMIDQMETDLGDTSAGGLLDYEMQDSDGNSGALGQLLSNGAPDIDPLFYGAVQVLISGS